MPYRSKSDCRRRLPPPSGTSSSIAAVSDREDAAVAAEREAQELLLIEEVDAWFEYLEETRGRMSARYIELEP